MSIELRSLASNPSYALELGKAAEHIVCADLILQGYRAFLSDQGLPYDVLLDLDGKIVRVQVKASCFPRNVNAAGRNPRIAYSFSIRRRGKHHTSSLTFNDCDIVALVALDIRAVAYIPIEYATQTMQLLAPDAKPASVQGWLRGIDEFPLAEALNPIAEFYSIGKAKRKLCINGHDRSMFSKTNKKGIEYCLVCQRDSQRRYKARTNLEVILQ